MLLPIVRDIVGRVWVGVGASGSECGLRDGRSGLSGQCE